VGVTVPHDDLSPDLNMTTQAGLEKKERDFLAQCVGDAYQMLDVLPGVDPNSAAGVACRAVRAIASRRLPACSSSQDEHQRVGRAMVSVTLTTGISGVATAQVTMIVPLVVRVVGRECPQADRRQKSLPDHVDDRRPVQLIKNGVWQ
jgi:hypothetical protein